MKLTTVLVAVVGIAVAYGQSAGAADISDTVAVRRDVDTDGFVYNPIQCHEVKQCGCKNKRLGGYPQCSRCPDDKGSSSQWKNVCWCAGLPHNVGVDGRECNPSKFGGPKKIDIDSGGNQYIPIKCNPRRNSCGCSRGHAECGRCPFDNGSQFQYNNVCWCNFGYGHPSGECNPKKHGGPFKNYKH